MTMQFTPEIADQLAQAQLADLLRRSAKLKRLVPDASPYTNLFAPWLDYEEGDPERVEDFTERAASLPPPTASNLFGFGGITNSVCNRWF